MTKDKKQINIASSCFGVQKYKNNRGKWKHKKEIICYYNKTKVDVDLLDCFAEIYKTQRKTYKCWKSLFFYFIDIIIHNCSIIYNYSDKYHKIDNNNSSLFFRKILCEKGPKSCENCKKNKNIFGKNYKRINFKCNKFYVKNVFTLYIII